MQVVSIGKMLKDARESVSVTREKLCEGLCSKAALANYENGIRTPDSLLFYTLIRRLGKSPERFCIYISDQESDYYDWRRETQVAIANKDWERLKKLKQNKKNIFDNNIELQYDLFIEALLHKNLDDNLELYEKKIKLSTECTVQNVDNWKKEKGLVSTNEINLLLLYYEVQFEKNRKTKKEVYEFSTIIEKYIEENVKDIFEKAKIYPRIICFKLHYAENQIDIYDRIILEKKVLAILTKTSEIYDMPEIMRLLIHDLHDMNNSEAIKYEKQLNALLEVLIKSGIDPDFRLEKWYDNNNQIYLLREYLLAMRKESGLTQEKISEGICAVETYSRIENGKRAPNENNMLKLASRISNKWGYYQSQILTDNFQVLELMTKQRIAAAEGKMSEALELLYTLRNYIDMTIDENRQYIEFQDVIIRKEIGLMDETKVIERLKEILSYTLEKQSSFFYSKTEREIILRIANYYRTVTKEYQKAIEILNSVLSHENKRKYADWYGNGVLKRLLAGIYADLGEYDVSNKIAKECIKEMLEMQDANMLSSCINLIGWNNERHKTNDFKQIYLTAILLSDLFHKQKICEHQKEYYLKNIDPNEKLY